MIITKNHSRDKSPGLVSAQTAANFLALILTPVVSFFALEFFTHDPFEIMTLPVILLNILFYEMVYLLIFFISGRVRAAVMLGALIFLIIGLGNHYVVLFRSSPILPWDIYSLNTAASVAGNYNYVPDQTTILCILTFVCIMIIGFFCRYRIKSRRLLIRLLPCGLILLAMAGYVHTLHSDSFVKRMKLYPYMFTPNYMAKKNGFTTTFLMGLRYMTVSEPSGYLADQEKEILSSYKEETDVDAGDLPNIIVIMNEAFSDLSIFGDFETNQDYMPFMHSLEKGAKNAATGLLNVSVKGGNTANTEFEFLTGNSMRFLPGGSIPYQQYIFGPKAGLVSWLETLGYQTAATHPFNSTGWNRDKVYSWFGFDSMYFSLNYPANAARTRKYINDKGCYDMVKQIYETRDDNSPLFLFTVTMQNHSGFNEDFENFNVDVSAAAAGSRSLDRYLSLIKLSDEALEDLVNYFKAQDEKTILVFFGDHQPNDDIVSPILKLYGKSPATLTEQENTLRYKVPYLIWANYDIESESGGETSANYLANKVLEKAGLPLSSYQQFLLDTEKEIPIISTQRLTRADGSEMTEKEENSSESLKEYEKMQYYRMYDDEDDAPTELSEYKK